MTTGSLCRQGHVPPPPLRNLDTAMNNVRLYMRLYEGGEQMQG
jgi:hypothetical protein